LRCAAELHSRRGAFLRRFQRLRGRFSRFLCFSCLIRDLARGPVCCLRSAAVSSAAASATTALCWGFRCRACFVLNFAADR
jgi:hypothetical protein